MFISVILNRIISHRRLALYRYSDNAALLFALSHNPLSQPSKVIVSKRYRYWYIEAVITS
jgi:hypothetical protein